MIIFDCGMHAREWISSAACLYIIQVGTNDFLCGMHAREWISSAACLYIIQVRDTFVLYLRNVLWKIFIKRFWLSSVIQASWEAEI
jgi:hypothetical protein